MLAARVYPGYHHPEVVTIPQVRERSVTEERALFGERRDADSGRRFNGGVFNERGGRAWRGLGHRFAAAWVRVWAAFGDGYRTARRDGEEEGFSIL